MRSLTGLPWALGGAAAGLIVGLVGATVIAGVTDMPDREGARGYFALAIGLIGAVIEMEVRVSNADLPASASDRWLSVEVQTEKTRPEGTVIWSAKRTEGEYSIIPVAQGPLYRSGSRMIVVRVGDQQVEVFSPPMKRTPDPKADRSEWYRPRAVDPPYGVVPPAPLKSKLELRYKLRIYGQ